MSASSDPKERSTQGEDAFSATAGAATDLRQRAFVLLHAVVDEHYLKLSGLEHLPHDVAAALKLAFDVELGNGWPIRKFLYAFPEIVRRENVYVPIDNVQMVQNLYHLRGEPALWRLCCSLHEQYDIVRCDLLRNKLL